MVNGSFMPLIVMTHNPLSWEDICREAYYQDDAEPYLLEPVLQNENRYGEQPLWRPRCLEESSRQARWCTDMRTIRPAKHKPLPPYGPAIFHRGFRELLPDEWRADPEVSPEQGEDFIIRTWDYHISDGDPKMDSDRCPWNPDSGAGDSRHRRQSELFHAGFG